MGAKIRIGTLLRWTVVFLALVLSTAALAVPSARADDLVGGKPGSPVHLVVGYQPYYSESWSGAVIDGLQLWKRYLPPGSTVQFRIGLQGSIIVNAMLAGKESIGYLGDMPAIVGATKRNVADLRIVANIGLSHDQCNVILVRNDAPAFVTPEAAIAWLQGKTIAAPKGSCADRFAQAVFLKDHVTPRAYLNQSIEVITSGFRAGKIDAAVVWEPTASRLVLGRLARRVATGNDVDEEDGAFIDMRADLLQKRPDIAKDWLETELAAEQYLANPANAASVVRMVKAETTGFTAHELWQALFGAYTQNDGGTSTRLTLPFAFTPQSLALIGKDTAFLHAIKSISVARLAPDAVLPGLTASILKPHHLSAPVGTVAASSAPPVE